MFAYLASLSESLQYNTIEYIYGHYLTLVSCTEWSQPSLHSADSNCW